GGTALLGNGDGTFSYNYYVNTFYAGTNPRSVAVEDFNADGIPDLAVANYGSNNVSVLSGYGNGAFSPPVNYGGTGLLAGPASIAAGDFNGDGIVDLAVADFTGSVSGNASVLLGIPASNAIGGVTPNNGSGAVQMFTGTFSQVTGYNDLSW